MSIRVQNEFTENKKRKLGYIQDFQDIKKCKLEDPLSPPKGKADTNNRCVLHPTQEKQRVASDSIDRGICENLSADTPKSNYVIPVRSFYGKRNSDKTVNIRKTPFHFDNENYQQNIGKMYQPDCSGNSIDSHKEDRVKIESNKKLTTVYDKGRVKDNDRDKKIFAPVQSRIVPNQGNSDNGSVGGFRCSFSDDSEGSNDPENVSPPICNHIENGGDTDLDIEQVIDSILDSKGGSELALNTVGIGKETLESSKNKSCLENEFKSNSSCNIEVEEFTKLQNDSGPYCQSPEIENSYLGDFDQNLETRSHEEEDALIEKRKCVKPPLNSSSDLVIGSPLTNENSDSCSPSDASNSLITRPVCSIYLNSPHLNKSSNRKELVPEVAHTNNVVHKIAKGPKPQTPTLLTYFNRLKQPLKKTKHSVANQVTQKAETEGTEKVKSPDTWTTPCLDNLLACCSDDAGQRKLLAGGKPKKAARKRVKSSTKKLEQLYIDAGQRDFGHVSCPTCGMVYTKAQEEDEIAHAKYHQRLLQKLKFKGWKSERVLQLYDDGKIVLINCDDHKLHWKKVTEVREVVDWELGFTDCSSGLSSKDEKAFLFVSNQKVVGCVIAVEIKKAYPIIVTPDAPSPEKREGVPTLSWCCSTKPVSALCGISRVWVIKNMRRQKIAQRLIDCVRNNFIFGCVIGKEKIAFSDPTPAGRAFAENYIGSPNILVFR